MDLYREILLDHYKNPRNFGKLKDADFEHKEFNASCGDEISIAVKLDASRKRVAELKFIGKGCAISQAATSMLTSHAKGKTLEELHNITKEDIFKMLGTEVGAGRIKCALIGLKTLMRGVEQWEGEKHG